MGIYAVEAISDVTAAIICMVIFFVSFPKILGKIKLNV